MARRVITGIPDAKLLDLVQRSDLAAGTYYLVERDESGNPVALTAQDGEFRMRMDSEYVYSGGAESGG